MNTQIIEIAWEVTQDGIIADGLRPGFCLVPRSDAEAYVLMNARQKFFPYDVEPVIIDGKPVKENDHFVFKITPMADVRI